MPEPLPASRPASLVAYCLSASTTLLWVGCVLPAGALEVPSSNVDAATPFHREGLLLVPAVLLLVLLPVGCALTRRFRGGQALLAATDAFIAIYASIAIWATSVQDGVTAIICGLLLVLGLLSAWETVQTTRAARRARNRFLRGVRLAVCVIVLMAPAQWFLESNVERASMLAPFVAMGVSTAGANLARTAHALRLTSAIIQLALALHVAITLRFTLFLGEPTIARMQAFGTVTWGLGLLVVALAILQVGVLMRERRRHADAAAARAAEAPPRADLA